jgi:hypothetical protein
MGSASRERSAIARGDRRLPRQVGADHGVRCWRGVDNRSIHRHGSASPTVDLCAVGRREDRPGTARSEWPWTINGTAFRAIAIGGYRQRWDTGEHRSYPARNDSGRCSICAANADGEPTMIAEGLLRVLANCGVLSDRGARVWVGSGWAARSGRIGGQDESDGPAGVYAVVLSAFLVDFTNDLSATLSTNPWPRPTFHGTIALRGR